MNKDEPTQEVKEVVKAEEKVIENPTRGYFFPHHNIGFEAESLQDAQNQLEEYLKKTKKENA